MKRIMEIEDYVKQMKEIQNLILSIIDNKNEDHDNFNLFSDFLDMPNFGENPEILTEILHFLLKLTKNHYRQPDFSTKIDQILKFLEDKIKQIYSNHDIFNIFKKHKLILFLSFKNKIIEIDQFIIDSILESSDKKFIHYFYPEIKKFIGNEKIKKIEEKLLENNSNIFSNFEKKQLEGENDSHICEMIRNDSVEEFIAYVNRLNISLSSKINQSIFETNSFLLKNQPTLIEYSAFYGSIQIFQYLKFSKVELKPSLWLYAIHSNNAELIHILEENNVKPDDLSFEECLEESIKCHHNEIAEYILNNKMDQNNMQYNIKNKYNENIFSYSFHYNNYEFFPTNFDDIFCFCYACQYNYITLVNLLLNTYNFNVNAKIIFKSKYFVNEVVYYSFFYGVLNQIW